MPNAPVFGAKKDVDFIGLLISFRKINIDPFRATKNPECEAVQ